MRIEAQIPNRGILLKSSKNGVTSGKFQETLAASVQAKRTADTYVASPHTQTLEAETAVEKESLAKTEAARPAITILPGDSTNVKLAKLRQISETTDYTGMSSTKIYCEIFNRYNNTFDGNLEAIRSCLFSGPDWCDINNQFSQEFGLFVRPVLLEEIYNETGLRPVDDGFSEYYGKLAGEVCRTPMGYSGMDYEEREQAILAKYAGKNTLMDFLNMQGELFNTGVLSHKMGFDGTTEYMSALRRQFTKTYFWDDYVAGNEITQSQYDYVLRTGTNFNARSFLASVKESLKDTTFSNFDFDVEGVISDGIDNLLAALDRQKVK